jgi:trehalose 6-phosphate phosphatase
LERVAERFRALPRRAGIFLDFDGTLADIAPRPELARPRPETRDLLPRLARRYAVVAVVSARREQDVHALLGLPDIPVFGLYGLSERAPPPVEIERARAAVDAAAAEVEGAWVEDKGQSLAVHYRSAPSPERAGAMLSQRLSDVASSLGLVVITGKMVLEVAPPNIPGKGAVIERECRSGRLAACLYAGDDLADLDAFRALTELEREGLTVARVAVRSEETPTELIESADVVVDRPAGLMQFLSRL